MSKSEYQDGRWQKRRLETLAEFDWTCQMCEAKESDAMLHVHHVRYDKDRPIWEANQGDLTVLCQSCHGKVSDLKKMIGSFLHNVDVYVAMDKLLQLIALAALGDYGAIETLHNLSDIACRMALKTIDLDSARHFLRKQRTDAQPDTANG